MSASKVCPMHWACCLEDRCEWYSGFAKCCSVPLIAGMIYAIMEERGMQ